MTFPLRNPREDMGGVLVGNRRTISASAAGRALFRVIETLSLDLDFAQVFRRTTETAMDLLQAQFGAVAVPDAGGSLVYRLFLGFPEPVARGVLYPAGADEGLAGVAYRSREPQFSPDALSDPRVLGYFKQAGGRSLLCVPIWARGDVIGVMSLGWSEPVAGLSPGSLRVVDAIARQIGVSHLRDRMAQDLLRSEREARRAARLQAARADLLACAADFATAEEHMSRACRLLVEEVGYDSAAAIAYRDGRLELVDGAGAVPALGGAELHWLRTHAESPVAEALHRRDPAAAPDLRSIPAGGGAPFLEAGWRSLCAAPIAAAGRVAGILLVGTRAMHQFGREEQTLLHAFAGDIGRSLDLREAEARRREAEERVRHIAFHDMLTGLPNRAGVRELLQSRLRNPGQRVAIAVFDLDEFKQINDTLGHAFGDAVIVAVAHRLRDRLPPDCTVARPGTDEFIVVCSAPDRPGVERGLAGALGAISESILVGEQRLALSASVGVAIAPDDGRDLAQLLRRADTAMHHAKGSGGGQISYFSQDLELAIQSVAQIRQGIIRALQEHEFRLYYQPQVDLASGSVVGVEALIRWQDPTLGLRMPGDFLPIAEGSRLGVDIGRWVIREALRQLGAWRRAGTFLRMAVNVTPRHIMLPDFVPDLREALRGQPDVPPGALQFELTEATAAFDLASIDGAVRACQELGIGFALDDFGTGHSSITRLRQLALRLIKIDRSFVRNQLLTPEGAAVIQGILVMGSASGLEVLAEGIETPEEAHMLLRLGCSLAQGYAIARPMPADSVPAWIAAWPSSPMHALLLDHQTPADFWRAAAILMLQRRSNLIMSLVDRDRQEVAAFPADEPNCEVSSWIRGPGSEWFGGSPEFALCQEMHTQGHRLLEAAISARLRGGEEDLRQKTEALVHWRDRMHLLLATLPARSRA